jgi:hypothetical protein
MGLLGLTSREVDQTERDRLRQAALPFLESEALRPADFTIRDDRVVKINPDLARRMPGVAISC